MEDGSGRLLGAIPCYAKSHSQGEYVFDHGWADAYMRAGGRYYPKLQISVPFTPVTGRRLLVRPGQGSAEHKAILLQAAVQVANRLGVSSLHITFPTRDEWQLAEIEQVLAIAQQQLQLSGNVRAALLALQQAEGRLARADRPQFLPVRRALARDIERLRAVPGLDLSGISLKLDSLVAAVDSLPLEVVAQCRRKDSSVFAARIWVAPLRGPDGAPRGVIGHVVDINHEEQRRAQRQRDREEAFRALCKHSNDAIFIHDPAGDQYYDVNPRACLMLGYSREALLARRPLDLYAHELDEASRFLQQVHEQGAARTDALSCRTRDGDLIPCEISASTIKADGRAWILSMVRDVRTMALAPSSMLPKRSAPCAARIAQPRAGASGTSLTYRISATSNAIGTDAMMGSSASRPPLWTT